MSFLYKLLISYDGTDFGGWQWQKERSDSIVQVMQDAYFRVFKHEAHLIGASRTDAGVHAIGQVALCATDLFVEPSRLLYAWNNALPEAIRISKIEAVDSSFHPYRAQVIKTYWYHFFIDCPLPFGARYGWFIRQRVDSEKLKEALHIFIGTHDFTSFCTRMEAEHAIRTIFDISITFVSALNCYRISICGNGFLRHMIRRIVGAAMMVATHDNMPVSLIEEALTKKDANNSFPTAPAKGLMLYSIQYE